MAGVVGAGDGDERAEQPGVYRCGGGPAGVEVEGEEADGDVESLARDLVAVDEGAPVSVDGDEAEGRGGPGYGAAVGGVCGSGGGRGEVAVGGVDTHAIWWLFRRQGRFRGCGFVLSFGTPAAGSGALLEAGV